MCTSLPSVACALVFATAAASAEPATTNSITGLSECLRALTTDKARSYQQLLRDASHEVREATLDRPWSEVEPALRHQGLRQIHARDNQHTSDYRYLVTKEGWIAGDRTPHSLYLEFSVDRRTTNTVASAKSGFVMAAEAGLFVAPNRAYAQVLTNGAYSDGSVLFRGLRLPEVSSAAQSYPILKKVEISYDFIRDRWSENVAQGFSLHLTFGDSTGDDRRGKRLYFTAASGLDALQDWQGRPIQKQFEPQDTVGEFRAWGSNEWKQTD
jgi:hypothetical protein